MSAGDETLRPRKGKWGLVLLGSGAFVAGGIWMVRHPDSWSTAFCGYAGILFFGLGVVVAIIQLIPNSSFLWLGPDGMTVCTMWRSHFYRWSDIERFGVAEFTVNSRRRRLVGMDFSASYPHRNKAKAMKEISRNLSGFEGALPDNYGWDYAELAAHLNRLREKHAGPIESAGPV